MPQLLKPYNPWYMGIEAAVAAAVAANALQPEGLSLGAAATVAVVIGSWNYYVQKNYAVPDVLIERAEVLKFKEESRVKSPLVYTDPFAAVNAWEQNLAQNAAKDF